MLNHIIQVGDVILSPDIFTEYFCCDLEACKGQCCVDGDSGAPVTPTEQQQLEAVFPEVKDQLSAKALRLIERQGVTYVDADGDLVTSIVNGQDCVFTCHDKGCCLCTIDKAYRAGRTSIPKPMSCYLYPIREKALGHDLIGLNYHRWDVCRPARRKGRELQLRLYQFLKAPLIRRFGEAWYSELEAVANALLEQEER